MLGRLPGRKTVRPERTKKKWQEELESEGDTPIKDTTKHESQESQTEHANATGHSGNSKAPQLPSDIFRTSPRKASPGTEKRRPSPTHNRSNTRSNAPISTFMDILINNKPCGRLIFKLYTGDCPRTCENFRALCTGEKGRGRQTGMELTYEGCAIHRVVPGFVAQGGDFSRGDGSGGESIYGGDFADESFKHSHSGPGLLSMANAGPHTNGSQFFVTFDRAPSLNGKHVVFGRLVSGMDVLRQIEKTGRKDGETIHPVVIDRCGEVMENEETDSSSRQLYKDNHEKYEPRQRRSNHRSRSPVVRNGSCDRRSHARDGSRNRYESSREKDHRGTERSQKYR